MWLELSRGVGGRDWTAFTVSAALAINLAVSMRAVYNARSSDAR